MIKYGWMGIITLVVLFGCSSAPPHELIERGDHGSLARWYEKEAAILRGKADEMRAMLDEYAKPSYVPSPKESKAELIAHCESFLTYYNNAAAEAEALAKLQRAMEENKR